MKNFTLSLALLFLSITSIAQFKLPTNRSTAGVQIFVPTGNLANTHFLGLSADLQMEMKNPNKKTGDRKSVV